MPKKPEKTLNSTLRLPVSLHAAINRVAERKRLSMAQAIIQAIDEYIQRERGKQ